MESLFHETYTETFAALLALQNKVSRGANYRESDLLARLPHVNWAKKESAAELLRAIFRYDEQGFAVPLLRVCVPVPLADLERMFLKNLLTDARLSFLLPASLREKLLRCLADTPALAPPGTIVPLQDKGDDLAALQGKLALFWRALQEKRQIRYRNRDRKGELYDCAACPCRLEYDARANRARAIVYLWEEHRAVKLNFSSLEQLEVLETPVPPGTEESFRNFLKSRERTVTLMLAPKTNAVPRTFALFAPYDKEAIFDEETGRYTLDLHYYDFDTEEILRQILSLGSAATVLAPEELRAQIIERLQAEWAFLHGDA